MILKDEITINCASPIWQGNLSDEQGLFKCAEFRKLQSQGKSESDEGGDSPVCISSSKGTVVSAVIAHNVGETFYIEIHLQ